ncbi:MAG: helix-turn-helix transcriptional regulator [Symploca sp. SIO2E9]|nr:helix-turn-helix transcriptional regulator [Symploca sp. SIO2E9]
MVSFGDKIKKRRESLNFTQRQLALKLDMTVTTVQNWESGRHIPKLTPKQMKLLCDLLNFTLEELAE